MEERSRDTLESSAQEPGSREVIETHSIEKPSIEGQPVRQHSSQEQAFWRRPVREHTPQGPHPSAAWAWVIEVSETVLPAIVIAVLINLFLAQATRVYGHSMEPNLHTDQRLVVEKLSYRLHSPRRTDVVVLHIPDHSRELLIKRVIALPGETIQIKNGSVYIDGELLDEPYLNVETRGSYGPLTIPPDHVFVMGDNRGASNDSRSFGPVHNGQVVGRAWVSYWPIEVFGTVK